MPVKAEWILLRTAKAATLNNTPCAYEFYKQQQCSIFTCQETHFLPLEKFYIAAKHITQVWVLGQLYLLIQVGLPGRWIHADPDIYR